MRTLLLDANSLIMRCVMASALDDLKANGQFTGGVYGTLRTLRVLVAMPELPIDRVVAFFDHGVPDRRLRLLPGYKQARKERRELLPEEERERAFAQIDQCFALFEHLGILSLRFKKREADDGVAAAVRVLATKDHRPLVVSSDRDLLQTVRMGADVWDLGGGRLVTPETFHEVTGVTPDVYTTFRALVGDKSDSVAGARGCGPARAAELLAEVVARDPVELPPPFGALTPLEQVREVGHYLRGVDRPLRAWEEAVLRAVPRLERTVLGVDLSASFGPTERLAARLEALPPVSDLAFLRACRDLGMRSVLGDPEGYLRPFRKVEQRRLGKMAGRRV